MNLNLYNKKKDTGLITTKELAKRWGKSGLTIRRYRQKGFIEAVNKQSPFGRPSTYYFNLEYIMEIERKHNIGSN